MSIERKLLDELKPRLRGGLLLPEDSGYDEARSVWNAMIDRKPAAIARCLGTVDVTTCVNFARERDIPLSIKGGGHNIAGLAVCDGGLMMDMSLMRGVWVDLAARTARAQAGCLLGDVDRETQIHGLAAVLGFVSNTGVAGLTLGGGFGYITRRFGWTCDNVRSMEIVTSDGRLTQANEKQNEDLFWALRGGGGNFGVVTSFEYTLEPIGPEIVGGGIVWPMEDAPRILEMFRRIAEDAPPEFSCVAVLRIAPPAPWIRSEFHGKRVIALFVCDTGPQRDAEARSAKIKGFLSPIGDTLQRRSYVSQQSLLDATQPKGRRYYWKSEYLPGLNRELFDKAMEHANHITSPHSGIVLFPLGGALNRLPNDYSPAGNRDATWVLNITAAWDKPQDDETNIGWARTAWNDMRGLSTGGTYVNFLTEEEGDVRIHAAYGGNYERLVAAKTRWDPSNLFRSNKNIAPRK